MITLKSLSLRAFRHVHCGHLPHGHFMRTFMDEAGQATESEISIKTLADSNTNTPIARELGLQKLLGKIYGLRCL